MTAIESLSEGIGVVDEVLPEPMLEPDLARRNWSEASVRVSFLERTIRERVLAHVDPALAESPELGDRIRERVAGLLRQASAVLFASANTTGADRLLGRALELATDGTTRAEIEAARRDPASSCRLEHGFWLQMHGRDGAPPFREVQRQSREPALRDAARKALSGPKPIKKAPTLFQLNGVGFALYGRRDQTADGSYVSTHCFSFVWIPILPLAAYRVREVEANTYQFLAREPLGRFARVWRGLVGASVVIGALAIGVTSYFGSPSYQARKRTAAAKALEASGDRTKALAGYRGVVTELHAKADVSEAAEGVVRLTVASLPTPCTPDAVPVAGRVMASFEKLPKTVRSGRPATVLGAALGKCVDEVGETTAEASRAGLELIDMAVRTDDAKVRADFARRRVDRRLALADRLAADRPMDALLHYAVVLPEPRAAAGMGNVLQGLGDSPATWTEIEPEALAWAERAKDPAQAEAVARVRALLERGKKAAAAADEPDAGITSAAAARERGDSAGCVATLRAQGMPGRLAGRARRLLGQCLADGGQVAEAEAVLSEYLEDRLAPFQAARRAYSSAAEAKQEALMTQAQNGVIPPKLRTTFEGSASDVDKQAALQDWMGGEIDKDAALARLRSGYLRYVDVVPASLSLGLARLRLAGDSEGDVRARRLDGAERAFLSIREEAEGAPTYHLGLGQVYHRLGKVKEGDGELTSLLDRKEPELTLSVAEAYRELGLTTRAREIAEGLWASAADPEWKQTAALNVAHLVRDIDEEAQWLSRCNPKLPEVRRLTRQVEGARALRDGELVKADKAYAEVAAALDRQAAHNAVVANNAAVALMGRYAATGDTAHLEGAVRRLETAARLLPDNAILLGNLADVVEDVGLITVLESWIRTRPLHLSGGEAAGLISSLQRGRLQAAVSRAIDAERRIQRGVEMARQQQVLSPRQGEAYALQLRWLAWRDDVAGMEALARQAEAAGAFDEHKQERDRVRSGTEDAKLGALARKGADRGRDCVLRADATRHAPTRAAARALLAERLVRVAFFDPSAEAYDAAIAAYRQAMELWPDGGFEIDMSETLVTSAAFRATQRSPLLKSAWDKERRLYSSVALLHRAAGGTGGAEVLSILRADPQIAEAARLRRPRAAVQPELYDLLIARLAGDADLERSAAAVFSRPQVRLAARIEARISPTEQAQLEAALLDKGSI